MKKKTHNVAMFGSSQVFSTCERPGSVPIDIYGVHDEMQAEPISNSVLSHSPFAFSKPTWRNLALVISHTVQLVPTGRPTFELQDL